jgi:hypothetical protein
MDATHVDQSEGRKRGGDLEDAGFHPLLRFWTALTSPPGRRWPDTRGERRQ